MLRRMSDVTDGFVGALARLLGPGLDEEVVLEVAFDGVRRVCCRDCGEGMV